MRLLIIAVLALTLSSRADVLVYKGTASSKTQNDISNYTRNPRVYFIVDLASRESFQIFYFTHAGVKDQTPSFPLTPTRYTSGPGLGGKTYGAFTFLFDDDGVSNYGVFSLYLRGNQTTLPISSSKSGNFPKAMTGALRGAGRSANSSYLSEVNYVLSFDSLQTQTANNLARSGQQTYSQIQAELSAKGYQ